MQSPIGTVPRLRALPSDEIRQILWRYDDRPELQKVVRGARAVARGPVARLVAEGVRNSHEWDERKASLLPAFDVAGITALTLDPAYGGSLSGPKNLALALVAFELAWVDGGAATCSLAGHLALAPLRERGTEEQKRIYMTRSAPPPSGSGGEPWRGALCLTEPLPHVGVDKGVLAGKVRIVRWEGGDKPVLEVEKRGRFITNMGFARFVIAAVDSGDERIRGSCMVVLEEGDEGIFDRGTPTRKLVHQLSSTTDPVFRLRVPASRIVGGYDVESGVLVPRYGHGEVVEAVFRRTRVTVGLMGSAKLLSAVEPIIRYHRDRYRGGEAGGPGTPRHDLGLQQKEDALHRLVDVWATGEASASLGFAAARHFDASDPLERRVNEILERRGVRGTRARARELRKCRDSAIELARMSGMPAEARDERRIEELKSDPIVEFLVQESIADVLCPACKLWNTGHGANTMREAVSLMGGYGITENCPGFLGQKWMDAQLEATYEGPEAVQRRNLSITMTDEIFLEVLRGWIRELRSIAGERPGTGACTVASAMELWLWTLRHLDRARDAEGKPLYRGWRQGVTFPLADALSALLASRCLVLDVVHLERTARVSPEIADTAADSVAFLSDLCHVQAAAAAGEVGRICAELVFGYNRHPAWEGRDACFREDDLTEFEGLYPGISAGARAFGDVVERDGSHPSKAGPCAPFHGMEAFVELRAQVDGCLTGARLSKDRAAQALTAVTIPEALDYPA
jgi:alkylation response protein AidB-like acyl-CoA dehydrogenase